MVNVAEQIFPDDFLSPQHRFLYSFGKEKKDVWGKEIVVRHLGLACAPLLQKENIGGAQALESQVEEDRMLVRTAIFFHNVITTKVLER